MNSNILIGNFPVYKSTGTSIEGLFESSGCDFILNFQINLKKKILEIYFNHQKETNIFTKNNKLQLDLDVSNIRKFITCIDILKLNNNSNNRFILLSSTTDKLLASSQNNGFVSSFQDNEISIVLDNYEQSTYNIHGEFQKEYLKNLLIDSLDILKRVIILSDNDLNSSYVPPKPLTHNITDTVVQVPSIHNISSDSHIPEDISSFVIPTPPKLK